MVNYTSSKNLGFGTNNKKRPSIFRELRGRTIIAFAFFVIVLVLGISSIIINKVLEAKIIDSKNRQNELNAERSLTLERDIFNFPERADKAKKLLQSHIYFSKSFDFLRNNTLKTVFYNNVKINAFNKASLNLQASASSFNELSEQLIWFKNLPEVVLLKVDDIQLNSKGTVDFSLNISLVNNFFHD